MEILRNCAVCGITAPHKCAACKSAAYCSIEHQREDWNRHKTACRPFKIEKSDELGRYLVATRDIPAKSVIFIEPPLIIGPKWCLNESDKVLPFFPCVGCFQSTRVGEKTCPKCGWPVCSIDCEALKDPNRHGLECLVLSLTRGPTVDECDSIKSFLDFYRSDVLLTLRCLLLQWRFPDRWNKVIELESHDKERLGTRYYAEADERIVSFLQSRFLKHFNKIEKQFNKVLLAKRDDKILHRICGIMEVNALNIGLDAENVNEASALFENACVLEHTCTPNCYYTFDNKRQFKVTMRAGRDIKKGEHLSIMYTHMLWGTQMRQEHLWTNKYFRCKCERCLDPTELGTNISALRCIGDIGTRCGGTLLPQNPIDLDTEWHCDKCDVHISNERVDILLTNMEQNVDEVLLPSSSKKKLATVENLEALIEKMSHLLHENHYHLFALKHALIQCYGHQMGYSLNQLSDELVDRKIILCEKLLAILDALDPYTMRLTLYTGIALYELHLTLLEKDRRKTQLEIENNGNSEKPRHTEEVLQQIKVYVQKGRRAVSLNADITQGQKLIESFDKAADNLETLINELKI